MTPPHYQVKLAPAAERQIRKLSGPVQKKILNQLDKLQFNPRPKSIKKLSGVENIYRVRVGDYRVIYSIEDKILLVLILKIGDRKEIYRNLSSL